jgi:putative flippase GtrA
MDRIRQLVSKGYSLEFLRYVLVSALALIVDYGCYWILASNQLLDLPKAAVVGYTVGLIIAYFLIADRVFQNGWLKDKKHIEAFLFLLSGLLGIILTYIVVKVVLLIFGERINLAKLIAVGVSFIGVYIFRKFYVFKNLYKKI